MPSSYTTSLRLEKQFTGENVNVWGDRLNTAIERTEQAIAGLRPIALTGDYTLTTSNTVTDDARYAMLKFTGGSGAFSVRLPSVTKAYKVWNATTGLIVFTTGAGATVQVDTTDIVEIFCDGSNVKTLGYGGASLKAYIASVVVGGGATVPSLVGAAGKWLTNNGSITSWAYPSTSDISNYASDQAAKTATATALAIAFAVAL
ncbi:hypothetical protein [Phenylobacterium sp.]|jgi:hypothetical protein|uniref:hypothetical protein n=1 Tax=Phenylobacterium sp. TaxID=1871053 RepID=UPI002F415AE6